MATFVSVLLDTVVRTVRVKWMNVPQVLVCMEPVRYLYQ